MKKNVTTIVITHNLTEVARLIQYLGAERSITSERYNNTWIWMVTDKNEILGVLLHASQLRTTLNNYPDAEIYSIEELENKKKINNPRRKEKV